MYSTHSFPPLAKEAIEKFLPPTRVTFTMQELVQWCRRVEPTFHPANYGVSEMRQLIMLCEFVIKSKGFYQVARSVSNPKQIEETPFSYIEDVSKNSRLRRGPEFGREQWLRDR